MGRRWESGRAHDYLRRTTRLQGPPSLARLGWIDLVRGGIACAALIELARRAVSEDFAVTHRLAVDRAGSYAPTKTVWWFSRPETDNRPP